MSFFYAARKGSKMLINGEKIVLERSMTLAEFLTQQGYNAQQVAVELNGGIVSRKDFAATLIRDTDKIEIVSFVGGG